ncbi:MAG: hypothetical protein GQ570_06960 [Helicobacteraceae bacterium]|nr:hypothetical protein [Helicobacteraceae bacterium]
MSNYKVKTDFSHATDTTIAPFATNVLKHMEKNDHFKTPVPSLKDLQSATNAFEKSAKEAKDGTKEQTDIKNTKKKELANTLSKLAQFVNFSSDGDKAKLDSSGFELQSSKSSIGILPAPSELHVKDGANAGELVVSYSKVAKATSYRIIYTADNTQSDSKWLSRTSTTTSLLISGLAEAHKYYFKVAALSSEAMKNDHFNYTDTVSRISQ